MEDEFDINDLHNDNDVNVQVGDGSEDLTGRSAADDDFKPAPKPRTTDVDVPGIEKFLAQFNIEGGKIAFDNGEEKHFSELTSEEQFDILNSLANQVRPAIEQEYDLDEEEIGLLNTIRQSGKSVNEALNDLLNERVQNVLAMQNASSEDYENMDADAVYMRWLQSMNPEATAEELEEDLEAARKTKSYDRQVESIRQGFIQNQEALQAQQQQQARQAQMQEIEQDRAAIAQTAQKIEAIAGWQLDDDMRNAVLADLLEVNEHGDSLFLEQTFSDPETLFRVAWFAKYGEPYIQQMQDYYKQELTKKYRAGYEDARTGMPQRPISGIKTEPASKPRQVAAVTDENEVTAVEDLFED